MYCFQRRLHALWFQICLPGLLRSTTDHFSITWHDMGHGLQDNSDKMSHMLKFGLRQIKDLIGCIKIKVPWAMCQRSLIRGGCRNREWLGYEQKHRGEQGAVFKQPHHLATKQENWGVVRREVLQCSQNELAVVVFLDRMLWSCWNMKNAVLQSWYLIFVTTFL